MEFSLCKHFEATFYKSYCSCCTDFNGSIRVALMGILNVHSTHGKIEFRGNQNRNKSSESLTNPTTIAMEFQINDSIKFQLARCDCTFVLTTILAAFNDCFPNNQTRLQQDFFHEFRRTRRILISEVNDRVRERPSSRIKFITKIKVFIAKFAHLN